MQTAFKTQESSVAQTSSAHGYHCASKC